MGLSPGTTLSILVSSEGCEHFNFPDKRFFNFDRKLHYTLLDDGRVEIEVVLKEVVQEPTVASFESIPSFIQHKLTELVNSGNPHGYEQWDISLYRQRYELNNE